MGIDVSRCASIHLYYTRRMRRILLRRVATSLAVGLLTTLTITWLCAALLLGTPKPLLSVFAVEGSGYYLKPAGIEDAGPLRTVSTREWWGVTRIDQSVNEGWISEDPPSDAAMPSLPYWSIASQLWYQPTRPASFEIAAGWPFRCLWGSLGPTKRRFVMSGPTRAHRIDDFNGLVSTRTDLPYLPIVPGLLLNTALYAGTFFAAWHAPTAVHRCLRRRADRCEGCGYPLLGLPTAPRMTIAKCLECGHPSSGSKPPAD